VWTFSIRDKDMQPIDLSGSAITMSIKRQRGANVPDVWVGSTANGKVSIGGTSSNVVAISFDGDYPAGALVYDVEFVKDGRTVTYLTGQFVVKTEVTA
jgi:hypothetical protein